MASLVEKGITLRLNVVPTLPSLGRGEPGNEYARGQENSQRVSDKDQQINMFPGLQRRRGYFSVEIPVI